ncbi:MAG: N-acetyltransferase, partial [Ignavibacteria bacterium]|nr:N-acetyltransferase [Ignavibacteria bacterium]
YLAGVKKKYRGLGVDLLMAVEIVKTAVEEKFKFAESNPELETNSRVQAQWKYFNPVQHKRRRIYKKNICY